MRNQKGFSIVEILLLLIIIGLVGFVGWYVLQADNPVSAPSPDKTQTVAPTPASRQDADPADGYTLHENERYDYSFVHPSDWQVASDAEAADLVTVQSPDFTETTLPQAGSAVTAGASLEVSVRIGARPEAVNTEPLETKETTVDGIKASQKLYKLNPYSPAQAEYDYYRTEVSFEGSDTFTSSSTELTKGPRLFIISLTSKDKPADSDALAEIFEEVLQSFRVGAQR